MEQVSAQGWLSVYRILWANHKSYHVAVTTKSDHPKINYDIGHFPVWQGCGWPLRTCFGLRRSLDWWAERTPPQKAVFPPASSDFTEQVDTSTTWRLVWHWDSRRAVVVQLQHVWGDSPHVATEQLSVIPGMCSLSCGKEWTDGASDWCFPLILSLPAVRACVGSPSPVWL